MILPEEAGFPLGGADFSRYVLLEIHYNNPDKIAGENITNKFNNTILYKDCMVFSLIILTRPCCQAYKLEPRSMQTCQKKKY
jgi:hypothetical protein